MVRSLVHLQSYCGWVHSSYQAPHRRFNDKNITSKFSFNVDDDRQHKSQTNDYNCLILFYDVLSSYRFQAYGFIHCFFLLLNTSVPFFSCFWSLNLLNISSPSPSTPWCTIFSNLIPYLSTLLPFYTSSNTLRMIFFIHFTRSQHLPLDSTSNRITVVTVLLIDIKNLLEICGISVMTHNPSSQWILYCDPIPWQNIFLNFPPLLQTLALLGSPPVVYHCRAIWFQIYLENNEMWFFHSHSHNGVYRLR